MLCVYNKKIHQRFFLIYISDLYWSYDPSGVSLYYDQDDAWREFMRMYNELKQIKQEDVEYDIQRAVLTPFRKD